jgi:hypothetical protein
VGGEVEIVLGAILDAVRLEAVAVDAQRAEHAQRAVLLEASVAAQPRRHARAQLGGVERLVDEVVRAETERGDLGVHRVARAQEDHRDRPHALVAAHLGAQRHAVAVGQADVEQHEFRPRVGECDARRGEIVGMAQCELPAERAFDQTPVSAQSSTIRIPPIRRISE